MVSKKEGKKKRRRMKQEGKKKKKEVKEKSKENNFKQRKNERKKLKKRKKKKTGKLMKRKKNEFKLVMCVCFIWIDSLFFVICVWILHLCVCVYACT